MGLKEVEVTDLFIETLRGLGVDYLFINPGTDTLPIQEALSKLRAMGVEEPRVILCPHEGIAVAMAEGYAMVKGRPQLVLVHVDVGTLNAGSALHNVLRDRVPLVLCAGVTPSILEGGVRGSREIHVHWMQDVPDQSLILRDYVKWFYLVRNAEHLQYALARAFQVACSVPEGPSYLMLPREVLMERRERVGIPPISRYPPPSPPQGDPKALHEAASAILEAMEPVIITSYFGRRGSSISPLVELSELLSIPVLEPKRCRANFPTTHPNYQGRRIGEFVEGADLILLVDVDVPWLPKRGGNPLGAEPGEDARIIHIDIDPLKERIPLWGFRVDMSIIADAGVAISKLIALLKESPYLNSMREIISNRAARLREKHELWRERLAEEAEMKRNIKPVEPQWLFHVLNRVKEEDTVIIDDSVTNSGILQDYIDITRPETFYGLNGSNMGWGLPAALGASLALKDKPPIAITGDGSFIFSNPVAGLWVARNYGIPLTLIVLNNRGYAAVKQGLLSSYPEGWSKATGRFIAVDFQTPPRYEAIAEACGCRGYSVEEPEDLEETLNEAYNRGKVEPVLVEVELKSI
ncbi:MAG: thiamine pyrophosphate-requiring protein [Candidatus Bathyarchaeia archaeon]